jgi:hypothetical protein
LASVSRFVVDASGGCPDHHTAEITGSDILNVVGDNCMSTHNYAPENEFSQLSTPS